jgi:hypothetical protein
MSLMAGPKLCLEKVAIHPDSEKKRSGGQGVRVRTSYSDHGHGLPILRGVRIPADEDGHGAIFME